MHFLDARRIIERNRLIPRRDSRRIVNALVADRPAEAVDLGSVSPAEYEALRLMVRRKTVELQEMETAVTLAAGAESWASAPSDRLHPRNLAIYHLIQERFPEIRWTVRPDPGVPNSSRVRLEVPYVEGLRPTLTSLLLRTLEGGTTSRLHERYRCVYRLPPGVVARLSRLLDRPDMASASEEDLDRVVGWLEKGLDGNPLTVVTPVCPDYEAEELDTNVFRYTFDNLGSGVGVVARRFLGVLGELSEILKDIGVSVRFVVAIGDFEGFSDANLARVGLSEQEFRARLAESQVQFSRLAPIPVEVPLFTDICGGKAAWNRCYEAMLDRLRAGDYGGSGLDDTTFETIALSRRGLYRRWYRDRATVDSQGILVHQGAEYAAMGRVVLEAFENPMIFGADHARMAPFFKLHGPVPVLYMRNNYLGAR